MAKTLKPDDILSSLDDLTFEELDRLVSEATALRNQKRGDEEARLRREFEEKAARLGIDPATFFRPAPKPKTGKGISTLPPKYLGPNGEQYSGKGRRAGWLEELVKAGKNQEDYINPAYIAAKGGTI